MSIFAQKSQDNQKNVTADRYSSERDSTRATHELSHDNTRIADQRGLQEKLNDSPTVQAQMQIKQSLNQSPHVQSLARTQQMLNQSPRMVAQAKLAATLSGPNVSLQSQQTIQRQGALEEEELPKTSPESASIQYEAMPEDEEPIQRKQNNTGLPDELKGGIETLSGISVADVKVNYNSSRPAQLHALAYTQGADIHIGPGQEKHLPHEAWHAVQQKQGRVKPTMQFREAVINDDLGLEREADQMGAKAAGCHVATPAQLREVSLSASTQPVQRLTGYEIEAWIPIYNDYFGGVKFINKEYLEDFTDDLGYFLFGGLAYGVRYGEDPMGHFIISADHNQIQEAHQKLVKLLSLTGFLHPGIIPQTMSSIEYITPARDETEPSGKAMMEADIEAVEKHANESYSQAREDSVTPLKFTQRHVLTGVPKTQLQKWVTRHEGNWELFEPVVARLESLINDQLYLQQTTGVLPEDLPSLYLTASERLGQIGDRWGKVLQQVGQSHHKKSRS